jgi:hypothetical protein
MNTYVHLHARETMHEADLKFSFLLYVEMP